MRDVSDLRTQYQCEYRLHLKQQFGDIHSLASITGNELHQYINMKSKGENRERSERKLLPLLIIILTSIMGFLWIFW
nr:MAG: hypothetical protein AM325_10185 [Candidatus Thorarchaeota archaeon SMTZ1-45]